MSVLVEREPSEAKIKAEIQSLDEELTKHALETHQGKFFFRTCEICQNLLQKGNDACAKIPFSW